MEDLSPRASGTRLRGLLVVVSLLFAVLFLRLFQLQIAATADYARESEKNRINPKRVKATRGRILDRNGYILASNRASYTIVLNSTTKEEDRRAVEALQAAIGDTTLMKYRRRGRAVRLKRDADFREASVVAERLKDNWPLDIAVEPQRFYPHGSLAAHLIGYMGEVDEDDLRRAQAKRYLGGDLIGRAGFERVFEDDLRGRDGVRYVEVDVRNRIKGEFPDREQHTQAGMDLSLTIDLALQQAAEAAMPDSLAGCIVAMDVRTGAILALVSYPDFDPNVFVSYQSQKERKRLVQGKNNPLLNRAVQGRYPPGSILKMVAAVGALELGITDTLSTYEACVGSLKVGDVVFNCNNRSGHGEQNLLEAIETSCNVYFHHLVMGLGMDDWRAYAQRFGFGQPSGIGLLPEEYAGLLPDKAYYADKEGWTLGHLLNLVIGQGAMLATPVQVARYVATLANGGYLVTPHVQGPTPQPQRLEGLSASTVDIIHRAMFRVIYGRLGTGRHLRVPGVEFAGKSGTVQVPNREENDAWFAAFAPYANPEIAVVAVLEGGGGGGSNAGPVVQKVLEAYFSPAARKDPPSGTLAVRHSEVRTR
jgi:penicillin-binding protein 2